MNYGELTVVEALPVSRFYPAGGEALFRQLAGATIIRIGGTGADGLEGGGLIKQIERIIILDYIPVGSSQAHRVVFAFNENGMWIEFEGLYQGPDKDCPQNSKR